MRHLLSVCCLSQSKAVRLNFNSGVRFLNWYVTPALNKPYSYCRLILGRLAYLCGGRSAEQRIAW